MEPLDEAPERRVKDRLRRYSDLLDEIDMQERRLDQMRADMGGVRSPSCDGMPKGACDPDGVHRKAMVAMRLEDAIEAARLREEAERADGLEAAGFERGVRRPSDDAVAEAVSRVDAAAADYCAALAEAVELEKEAHDALFSVDDLAAMMLVRYYLLCAPSWDAVAKAEGYSRNGVHTAVKRVLASVFDRMPHRFRDPLPPAL